MRTADGSRIRGVIKNEDTFSLQMMDEREKLQLFSKTGMKKIERPQRSIMPTPHLSARDLENLIAFLKKTEPSEIGPGAWTPRLYGGRVAALGGHHARKQSVVA